MGKRVLPFLKAKNERIENMKTHRRLIIALGAIALMAGIVIGCSKTTESQNNAQPSEAKQPIPDGIYSAQVKTKNGEVLTISDKIINGESVKTTILNSEGEETIIPDISNLYGGYSEQDTYDTFEREFENYDCIKIIIETQNGFPNPGTHHYYRVYTSSYDEEGDCWYD